MRRLLPLLLLAGCRGSFLLGAPAFDVGPAELEVFDLFQAQVPAVSADAVLSGRFQRVGDPAVDVEGFRDGGLLRIRFMPSKFGEHVFALTLRYEGRSFEQRGTFKAKDARRRGAPRIDRVYPRHFVWEGSGERFLWNGEAADGLLGLDEATMRKAVDRLAELRVTRLRLHPAAAPAAVERVIRYARTKDVAVGLVLAGDGLRGAVARWAAFSNVMWELGDPAAGPIVKGLDPYQRLAMPSAELEARTRRAGWVDLLSHPPGASGRGSVLQARRELEAAGRVLPQVADGPAEDPERARRWAWEVATAGAYASEGSGLEGRARLMAFLEAAEVWRLEPRDDLIGNEGYCLAERGRRYVVVQPEGRPLTLSLEPGRYRVRRFDPRTGAWEPGPPAEGARWTAPPAATPADWAWILDRS